MVTEITFITGNSAKVHHAQEALNKFGIRVLQKKLSLIEPREPDPAKVVVEKALQAFEQLHQPLIVEDSGIFIRALNGFPQGFIHYAEETLGMENILKMMDGVEDRYAEFRQSLAYIEPGMTAPIVFSYIDGGYSIADKLWGPKYDCGEFDKILNPPGENIPLGQFDREWRAKRDVEMNEETIHYRQLAKWLSNRI